MKKLIISLGYFFIILFSLLLIYTLLLYFNLLSNNILNYFKLLIPLISILYSSYILGRKSVKKGYLEGMKLAFIIIFMFIIINLMFDSFNYKSILYYLIIFISSSLGAMIGINRKKNI